MYKFICIALLAVACAKEAPTAEPVPPMAVAAQAAPAAVVALPAPATETRAVELVAHGAHFTATWHFAPAKLGELFAADLTLTDLAGQPVPNPTLAIDVTMPAHGHGMMTDPELKPFAPTRWHVDGLKLHMYGAWQFAIRVESAGVKERLTAMYEQPPEATDGL